MEYAYISRMISNMDLKQEYDDKYKARCKAYALKLLNRNIPVMFDVNHVNQILQMKNVNVLFYNTFVIQGKRKNRVILAPSRKLKDRQRWILTEILEKIEIHEGCHGFIKRRSVVSNAREHINGKELLTIDIKDFFPSISINKVFAIFKEIGYTAEVANKLANLCCYEDKLPQGAPTSPYLANLVCRGMDKEISNWVREYNLKYTRYADDMTFSGDVDMECIMPNIINIIEKHQFTVNKEKTRIYRGVHRRIVTGVIIENNSMKAPKNFKRKLKQEIYYCKKFGVSTHLENIKSSKAVNYREYLYGKAYYIKMIEPKTGEGFLRDLDIINWDA